MIENGVDEQEIVKEMNRQIVLAHYQKMYLPNPNPDG